MIEDHYFNYICCFVIGLLQVWLQKHATLLVLIVFWASLMLTKHILHVILSLSFEWQTCNKEFSKILMVCDSGWLNIYLNVQHYEYSCTSFDDIVIYWHLRQNLFLCAALWDFLLSQYGISIIVSHVLQMNYQIYLKENSLTG